MVKCNLLKFSFVWNFLNEIVNTIVRLCNKSKRIFSFLSLINNSVTIGFSFLLLSISSNTVNIFRFLFGFYSLIFF